MNHRCLVKNWGKTLIDMLIFTPLAVAISPYKGKHLKGKEGSFDVKQKEYSLLAPRLRGAPDRERGRKK